MPDPRISVHDRVAALQRLDAIAFEANQIAAWLARCDVETESDMIEDAARSILAACWLLSRPIRAKLTAERWQRSAQRPG